MASLFTVLLAILDRQGIDGAALHPWSFPTAEVYAALLQNHGFVVTDIRLIPR